MKILITGGGGYIGSLLANELLKIGYRVVIVDIFMWGIDSILHIIDHQNLEIIKSDIRDIDKYKLKLNESDFIINLAAIVGYPACDANPSEAMSINVDAVKQIAKNISKNQILIQASTGSSYGKVEEICDENTPINPLTLYGKTKAEAEKYILDVNGISLRFATVYGISTRMRFDLFINELVLNALSKGYYVMYEPDARRTFLDVKDAVQGIIFGIDNSSKMGGSVYNLGDSSQNFTKREIGMLVKTKIEYLLHIAEFARDKDERDYKVNYSKITNLGYKSKVNINNSIDELIIISKIWTEKSNYRNY
jgi:nucleoside-diphosphate-sugar epimerase